MAVFFYENMIIECVNAGNDVLLNVKPDAGDIIEKVVRDRHSILPLDKNKVKEAAIIVSSHNEWFAKSEILDMKKFLEDRK